MDMTHATPKANDARTRAKNGECQYQGSNWARKDLRLAVYLRDGMACMWCGASLEDGVQLSLDHVTPHSNGGDNSAANLVCSCKKCNDSRGNRPAAAFAKATAGYVNHGVTAKAILTAIKSHTAQSIAPFRAEAKSILSRRPTWQAALKTAAEK